MTLPPHVVIGAASETAAARRGLWATERAPRRGETHDPNLRRWTHQDSRPATVLYVALVFLPLVLALSYSLTNKNLLKPSDGLLGFREFTASFWSDTVFKRR